MNLLLLFPQDRAEGRVYRVEGPRARHIREVLRAKVGDDLAVGLHEGPIGRGRIQAMEGAVTLECDLDGPIPERPRTDLVLAIPRPKSLARILREAAALGVDRLVLFRTWRVEKSYLDAPILEPAHHRPLLHEGMAQGMTTREPRVSIETLFKPFVEDRLGPMSEGSLRLVAHPYAARTVASLSIATSDRVTLVVGPEGGLIPYEVEMLEKVGFLAVTMGPRILRVETATVALLAQIDLLRSRQRP